MRKDVRFGLTIGGSLLALVAVWAVLDRGGQKFASDVSLAPPAPPADLLPTPQNSIPSVSSDSQSPAAPPVAKTDAMPATQPAGADASDQNSAARDWSRLLEAGGPTTQPAILASDIAPAITRPSGGAVISSTATHKVLSGETFCTIAAAVYGDSKYYLRLEDANPNVNPNRLRVGTVINVPDRKSEIAADPKPAAADSSASAPLDPTRSYRVRPSDTLIAIARKLYGDRQQWEKIYDANRDAIGPNPARLRVDMVLRLPDPPSVAMAN